MSSTNNQARILVFRGGAIGDFVLTLPALQAIRARWPGAHIELVGYPHIAELAVAAGVINKAVSLDKAEFARLFAAGAEIKAELSSYLRSFDLVISYLFDPDLVFQNNLLCAGARQVIYGPPLVRAGHAIDHYLKPLESLAIYPGATCPRLELSQEVREEGYVWLQQRGWNDVLAIHPGSGNPAKNWPLENFRRAAQHLAQRGFQPAYVIGEADGGILAALQQRDAAARIISGLSLTNLAGVLSNCRGFMGNDSGITHLAAAVGIQVVALFGPTDTDSWAPRGPRVRILADPDGQVEKIPLEAVVPHLTFAK
jgi:heptosyltransferase-2